MNARILHVSDLHAGRHESPEVEQALAAFVAERQPGLVIASGDLTHRGRRDQMERTHAFLASLGPPVLAVPGNHDIPAISPKRFLAPWAEFERVWGTCEPVHSGPELHVVGLNSVRPYRHQSGGLGGGRLHGAVARLREAPDGALRVAVLHHQLMAAPWRAARKRPLAQRGRVLRALADAGANLILSGHIHQSSVGERREFEVLGEGDRGVVLATAPGFGQPRPNRLGEARGLHLIGHDAETVEVETFLWSGGAFRLDATRRFSRAS